MQFTSLETAFYEIAQRAGGTPLRLAIIIATVISVAIANAIAAQAAVARVLFAMARDGKLPAVLARIHPRYLSPYVSILVVTIISFVVGLSFANRLDDLAAIVNFGALTSFALLHWAVINHYFVRQRSGDWLRHVVFPLLGMSIILYVLYEMDRAAKIMGAIWIGAGVLYYAALTFWVKRAVVLRV
jgi:amino acid transporter